jgi:hypothetical protein
MFVGAKGSSNLPPRAQHRIWAGQKAALEGSDAILLIGFSEENLRELMSFLSSKGARPPPDQNGESGGHFSLGGQFAGAALYAGCYTKMTPYWFSNGHCPPLTQETTSRALLLSSLPN